MLANFMIFQHIFLPKSDPMHFGLSGPMHLQRGRLFRAPTARRSVAPRTVELLWALNGRPGGSVGEKEVLTVRHGQRLTFLWGFGLSNQLGAAREIFLVSAPNTHGSKIAPFGSDFGMLGKLPKEAANLVSADISECRRKNWRFPPESGFGGCHPRILVSSHPAPLCYTPMHTICPDHRITGCFPLLTKMTL